MPGGLTLLAGSDASIPTPPAGKVTIYFSTDINLPAYKDDAGISHSLVGTIGPQGNIGVQGEQGDEPEIVLALPGPQGNPGPTGSQGPMGPTMLQEELDLEDTIPPAPYIPRLGEFWDAEIIKKNDTTVTNSAAYVEDTELRYQLVANGIYLVEVEIIFSSDSTAADYKWEWRGGYNLVNASQFDGWYNVMGTLANDSGANSGANVFWGNNIIAMPTNAADKFIMHQRFGIVLPATTTSDFLLVYRFAQNIATAAKSAITYADSRFRIKKLN